MPEVLHTLGSSALFMPHGHCYLWQPGLVWLQVLSNGAIALAYISIFATLVYLVQKIEDIPFQWMYVAFAIFIVACGITHVFDVYVIWHPVYWLDGSVRAVTAVASVGTALLLPPLVPKALALADASAVAHKRGIDLEQANRELGVLLDKTKELEQLKTQFFANVSHELRTPLALILGPVEELRSASNLTAEQRHSADVALQNARSLLRQVNDLLDVAKLEAGKMEAERKDTDVAGLLRLTASQFESLAGERKIAFRVDSPPTLVAHVDGEKLQRVLLNLLSNAFKFTPDGGSIRCVMRVSDGAADGARVGTIEVADSGPGIPAEHRAVIFERFLQLEGGTTRRFGGTGLGLAIAKEFVELHRGRVSVAEAAEGGALFRVELPLPAAQRSDPPTAPASAVEAAEQAAAELRPQTAHVADQGGADESRALVLVVEDNVEMNAFLSNTLARDHRVASAKNGAEGLAKARALAPDLVLTDVMMPGMGGDELLRAMRGEPALREVPVVVLSAKADDQLRLQLLKEGAQDYVLKPFSADEVRVRVRNLVAMKRARDMLQADLQSRSDDLEELARAVSHRQRELQTALNSLRVARDQALRASEVKTSFLSMVSHELRTPLTGVRLQIDRLARDAERGSADKHQLVLRRLDGSARRLEQLVDSLLEYARLQSGRLDLTLTSIDVKKLVEDAADEVRVLVDHKQLELELSLPATPLGVRSDERLLHIILINLLGNAIKFTKQGKVTVRASEEQGRLSIAVSDTGPGIPLHEQGRVFEAFEQLENVRRKHTEGVGLGLALVRELSHALRGDIQLRSEPGMGSTFTVTVPSDLNASTAESA